MGEREGSGCKLDRERDGKGGSGERESLRGFIFGVSRESFEVELGWLWCLFVVKLVS